MSRIADWPIASVTADDLERFKETRLREHQQAAVVALLRHRQKAHDDDNPADAATCDVCRRLTERQNGGHVTINRNLALLLAMWNWAILKGHTERTPFKVGPVTAVHLFREYRRHRRFQGDEETRLLAACGPHLHALVIAALETGCRRGELLSLQWWQVRWDQNELSLPAGKTKAKQDRFIPITQRLKAVLEMRRNDPAGNNIRRGGLHFHDLRREAASRLLEGHVPEHYVQVFLGHADLTTTSAYLATTRKGLHQQFRRYEVWREQAATAQESKQSTDAPSASIDPSVARSLHNA